MAGDWIKFETATPDKSEVWEVSDALSIDPDAVVGKLLRVWIWFDQHTENGNAPSVTKKLLDRLSGVTGFCEALISVGWMLDDGETLTLPNFERHNGKTAKNRALTAKRVADSRKKSNISNDKSNGNSVTSALPREEKRREEKNNKNNNGAAGVSVCSEPSHEDSEPPFETLPTNRFETIGEVYTVTFAQLELLQETYLAVNAIQTIKEIKSWLIANKVKRKTITGMPAFLNSWFKREQDKGGNRSFRTHPPLDPSRE